ncbi:hypothetical protein GCM10027202_08120 [Microvirgula curvata]
MEHVGQHRRAEDEADLRTGHADPKLVDFILRYNIPLLNINGVRLQEAGKTLQTASREEQNGSERRELSLEHVRG